MDDSVGVECNVCALCGAVPCVGTVAREEVEAGAGESAGGLAGGDLDLLL